MTELVVVSGPLEPFAEGFAAEPAEPQVDDHSVPAEGSNERAPADYWAAQRVADSGLPPA